MLQTVDIPCFLLTECVALSSLQKWTVQLWIQYDGLCCTYRFPKATGETRQYWCDEIAGLAILLLHFLLARYIQRLASGTKTRPVSEIATFFVSVQCWSLKNLKGYLQNKGRVTNARTPTSHVSSKAFSTVPPVGKSNLVRRSL